MRKRINRTRKRVRDNGLVDLHTLASLIQVDRTHHTLGRSSDDAAAACKIAFLAANPTGTGQLGLGEECRESQRELKLARYRGDFSFDARWAVTVDELIRCLNEIDPTVIHFAGHADQHGVILQDERGEPDPISPPALAMILRVAAPSARLVVLNSCFGLDHAEAVCGEVDAVVAMAGSITDLGARIFAARLYGALGNRKSIATAVAQGVARLMAGGLSDVLLPRCLTRNGLDAGRLVLSGPDRWW